MLKIPTSSSHHAIPHSTEAGGQKDLQGLSSLFASLYIHFLSLFLLCWGEKKNLSFLIHSTTALRYAEWRMRWQDLLQVPCGSSFICKYPSCTSLLFPSVLCHSSSYILISTCMEIMAQGCREAQPHGHRHFGLPAWLWRDQLQGQEHIHIRLNCNKMLKGTTKCKYD